jgi:hypothetical protein
MTPRVIINWIVQPHIDVVRPTFQTWQDLTFQMWQVRRCKRGKTDVSNVASETLQTWKVRRFRRGKRDVSKVEKETFLRWQERCFRGGKRDILKVARPTGEGISSDVVAMGVTILEVERETSWTWQ